MKITREEPLAYFDPNASQVRVQTSEGLKAARLKT